MILLEIVEDTIGRSGILVIWQTSRQALFMRLLLKEDTRLLLFTLSLL